MIEPSKLALERVRRERDLYARLLELGSKTELEPFLEDALSIIVEVTGAQQGYVEVRDMSESANGPDWFIAHGFSDKEVEDVRSHISSGIIAEALSSGETVDTPSALLDPRFLERGSVRALRIEAVLCVPVGSDPPIGALYLQGREAPGPFSEEDRKLTELVATHLAPFADNLLLRRATRHADDPTAPFRARLDVVGVVGSSPALAALLREVSLVAPLDVNVLLSGESGTGKSQIARVVHDNSPRRGGPFVELNCAALPEGLVESELFGALAGSHSTATVRHKGRVAAAEGGTLFLDEIGDLAMPAQAKLLQLLQSGHYYPLGAVDPCVANVRVIAATNRDLEAAVAGGTFREDLFYRLQVLPVRVPTLAERRSDVGDLARRFVESACERHGLPRVEISTGARRAIEAAEWPGNVRQLAHAVEAGAIRAAGEGAARMEVRHLFPDAPADPAGPDDATLTFQQATRMFQSGLLQRTLAETAWNIAETARRLDLARSHVYNLIRAFGLEREGK